MERLGTVVARVLADTRRRMDEKAGAGIEPSPGSLPRGQKGGTNLAGNSDRLSPRATVRRGTQPDAAAVGPGRSLASAAGLEPACGEVEFRWPSSWPTRPNDLEAAE